MTNVSQNKFQHTTKIGKNYAASAPESDSEVEHLLPNVVNHLKTVGLITDTLALGDDKFMGVCRLNEKSKFRRIDIRLIKLKQFCIISVNFYCKLNCIQLTKKIIFLDFFQRISMLAACSTSPAANYSTKRWGRTHTKKALFSTSTPSDDWRAWTPLWRLRPKKTSSTLLTLNTGRRKKEICEWKVVKTFCSMT